MQSWHINAVVSLRLEVDDQKLGVASDRYLHLPTRDNTPPSLDDLQRGVAFIKEVIEAGCSVYVHCGVGVGRAPTLAAAYMVSRGLSPDEAWQKIRIVRPFIWPTRAQIKQVARFADQINHRE